MSQTTTAPAWRPEQGITYDSFAINQTLATGEFYKSFDADVRARSQQEAEATRALLSRLGVRP
jgi:hypothetical protein